MKRNKHTTNTKRQMQGDPPHQHWVSNAAQRAWQKAATEQARQLLADGVVRKQPTPQRHPERAILPYPQVYEMLKAGIIR
jgi:hypothetical protein